VEDFLIIYYTIADANTIVRCTDSSAANISFNLSVSGWTQTTLPNGTPTPVTDNNLISELNARLTELRPQLPKVVGYLFYDGVYHGPTAVTQF